MAVGGFNSLNFGTTARVATGTPTLTQFINLSNYAYSSGLVPFTPKLQSQIGYKPLTANGQLVAQLDSATGFYGQAFISTGNGPKRMIVAFEGTNVVTPPTPQFANAQVTADAHIFLGQTAPGFQTALTFTNAAITAGKAAGVAVGNMFVTGHSLGAAQAEYVASYTGLGGVSFGTPALSTKVSGPYKNVALRNYVNNGDPVGNYAANPPRYMGQIVQANNIRHVGTTYLIGSYFNSFLLQAAAAAYAKHTVLGDIAAAGSLGLAADLYHPLTTYAKTLGVKLFEGDRTQGSGSNFFDPIVPRRNDAFGASVTNSHLRDFAHQIFNAAFTGGSMNTRPGHVLEDIANPRPMVAANLFARR